jgi:predicted RNA-binding Zn ribbon-like protein
MATDVRFPADWLDPHAGDVATDLDLAVLLVNSYDALDDPADRLQDLHWLTQVLRRVRHAALADALAVGDLPALRALRAGLRAAFEAADIATAARVLNPMLTASGGKLALVTDPGSPSSARLAIGAGTRGLRALQIRLPVAVAERIASRGVSSLGACHADPCHCVFVDRTRAGTRRYCCGSCNDRAAARAYRRRRAR